MSGSASVPGSGPPPIPDHEILGIIGHGSYGEVWLARNLLGTYRAVKIVHRHAFEDDKPFERELAGIRKYEPVSRSHEGLVQVLHVGRSAAPDCFYYVMELADPAEGEPVQGSRFKVESSRLDAAGAVAGEAASRGTSNLEPRTLNPEHYRPKTLRSEISRRGRVPLDELLPLSLSLTAALGHLHRQGLVHRDLKPSNIIFVQGRPKIADLGLVSAPDESRSFVGTEGFVPPEGPGTGAADLYSLGKALYEASTGKDRLNFPEVPADWLGPPPRKDQLEFHEIVLKACEGRVDKRYRRAEEVQADLALLQSGKSIRHLHQMERRVAFLTKAGLVAGVAAVLALAAYLFAAREARLERQHLDQMTRAEHQARTAEQEARTAEQRTKAALQESLLMQARAGRRSGLSGCRFDSLAAIRRAAAATNSLELRNEAIGCFALADLRVAATVPVRQGEKQSVFLDAQLEHYVWSDRSGAFHFRRLSDGRETFEFRPTDTNAQPRAPQAPTPRPPALATRFLEDVMRFRERAGRAPSTLFTSNAPPHRHLELSPNGQCLAVVTPRRSIHLYETTNGTWLRTLEGEVRRNHLRFSPDSQKLAVGFTGTNDVAIFNLASNTAPVRLPETREVEDLAWSKDSRTLVVACGGNLFHSWNAATGQRRQAFVGHESLVTDVAFRPTGRVLASTSWDGTTRLWDAATGQLLVSLPISGVDPSFAPDGRRLAFLSYRRGEILLCEVAGERVLRNLRETEPPVPPRSPGGPWRVEFSPDGQLLVTATFDGVRLWDAVAGEPAAHLPLGCCTAVFFHPQGRDLFVSSQDRGLQRWPFRLDSTSGGCVLGSPLALDAKGGRYGRGDISREDATLAYIHAPQLKLRKPDDQSWVVLSNSCDPDDSVAISPDGQWLARGDFHQPRITLWSVPSGREVWATSTAGTAAVAFTPDGRWLVSGSGAEYCFWDVPSGRPTHRLTRQNTGGLRGVLAFSPDGRLMAMSLSRTVAQLADVATGQVLGTLESPMPGLISWLAFSPDSTQLAIACESHVMQLWDLRKLRLQLAELGLDWDQPPYPPAPTHAPAGPLKVRVVR